MSETDKGEQGFAPYSDDPNVVPQTSTSLPYWARIRGNRSRWFSWKTALLVFVIIGLIVGRIVEGPIRAAINKKSATHDKYLAKPLTHPHGIASSVSDASDPTVSMPSQANIMSSLNDEPFYEDEAMASAEVGVSIAASVDGEGNRQIYDLNSVGVLRIRKIQVGTYKFTNPEIINITEKVQAASPLSAIAWKNPDGSIETRLIFVNKANEIIQAIGTQADAISPTKEWKTNKVHGAPTSKAYGGITFVNIGPRHDPSSDAGQLRILLVDQAGEIRHLNSLKGNFVSGTTGIKAAPGSGLSQAVQRDPATGQTIKISTFFVDPKGGGLKEILTDEKGARNTYKIGRTVDPFFPSTFPGNFAATYGGPPPTNRVYTLNPDSVGERKAIGSEPFTQSWWHPTNDPWYFPSKTGAPLAVVSWKDKEVRVVFKSKADEKRLVEVGLTDQGPGAGIKWFGRGFFH